MKSGTLETTAAPVIPTTTAGEPPTVTPPPPTGFGGAGDGRYPCTTCRTYSARVVSGTFEGDRYAMLLCERCDCRKLD